jgi:NAD(P)-dependent dehydrogenase (short-subunit alcohol dehydrogenase family)
MHVHEHKEKKSVMITGCSSGIGRCLALGLRRRGYRVFATARKSADVTMLARRGYESLFLDLESSDSIAQAVDTMLSRTGGRLYALINNGAYGQPGAVEDLTRETLRRQFEINVFGTQELTNRLMPVFRRQGYGRIVQISSVLGFVCLAYRGAYNATKHALEALSDTLRLELRGTNIHVSLVEPGPIASRFRANAYTAFKANIDTVHSVHRDTYALIERRLSGQRGEPPFTLPPKSVLKKVIHALEAQHPRMRYRVTLPTYFFAALKRVLPARWVDGILLAASGAGKRA